MNGTRREVLTAFGTVVISGGCLAAAPRDTNTTDSTGTEPACETLIRLPVWDTVTGRGSAGFQLSIQENPARIGEGLHVELENTTDSENYTGNQNKYTIQYRTSNGWKSVFWVDDDHTMTDEAVSHAPGTGFEWKTTFTETGLEALTGNDRYVCESLQSGRYRFVYFGLMKQPAASVEFEVG